MGVEGGYSAFEEKLNSGYYDGEHLEYPTEVRFQVNNLITLGDTQLLAAVHKYRQDRIDTEEKQFEYHEAVRVLEAEFANDIAAEYGMTDHPLRELLLQKAIMLALNEGRMNCCATHSKYQFLMELVSK
jgi:hypothetical protein